MEGFTLLEWLATFGFFSIFQLVGAGMLGVLLRDVTDLLLRRNVVTPGNLASNLGGMGCGGAMFMFIPLLMGWGAGGFWMGMPLLAVGIGALLFMAYVWPRIRMRVDTNLLIGVGGGMLFFMIGGIAAAISLYNREYLLALVFGGAFMLTGGAVVLAIILPLIKGEG